MNAVTLKRELVAMRSRIDELIEHIDEDTDSPSPWATVADYAKHANTTSQTIREWIKRGMPATDVYQTSEGVKLGRTVRIDIEKADAWRLKR